MQIKFNFFLGGGKCRFYYTLTCLLDGKDLALKSWFLKLFFKKCEWKHQVFLN